MIVTLNKINTNYLQTSKIFIVHQPSPPFPAHYQSHFFSRTYWTVLDVIPFLHCNVQNLSPNLEGKLSKASFHKFAYCSVAGGGPWSTTLVNLTALLIVSFPSLQWHGHIIHWICPLQELQKKNRDYHLNQYICIFCISQTTKLTMKDCNCSKVTKAMKKIYASS